MNQKLSQAGRKGGRATGPTKARPLTQERARQMAVKRWAKIKANTPDWMGCGKNITTESWEGFLAARKAYYQEQDKKTKMSPTDNQKPLPSPLAAL